MVRRMICNELHCNETHVTRLGKTGRRISGNREDGVVHPVLELINERMAAGSVPGERTDGRRLVIAIEGGSSRGTYSSGMALALDELGALPAFDAVYGSSAGALNGAWLLCGRSSTGVRTWWNPAVMRRIINPLHALRGRSVVDLDYLVHQGVFGAGADGFPGDPGEPGDVPSPCDRCV